MYVLCVCNFSKKGISTQEARKVFETFKCVCPQRKEKKYENVIKNLESNLMNSVKKKS